MVASAHAETPQCAAVQRSLVEVVVAVKGMVDMSVGVGVEAKEAGVEVGAEVEAVEVAFQPQPVPAPPARAAL